VKALFVLPLLALLGCVAAPEPAAPPAATEGEGPMPEPVAVAFPVVDGKAYQVNVALPQPGRAGAVDLSIEQYPELKGNEALARRVAGQACREYHGVFDDTVPGRTAFGAWWFDRACG
jgi:hypothetical protein